MSKKSTSLVPVKLDLIDLKSIPDAGHAELARREDYQRDALKKFWRRSAIATGSGIGGVWLFVYLLGIPVTAIGSLLAGLAGGLIGLAMIHGTNSVYQFFRLVYGSANRWLSRDIKKNVALLEGEVQDEAKRCNLSVDLWNEAVATLLEAEIKTFHSLELIRKEVEIAEERGEHERFPRLKASLKETEKELAEIRRGKKHLLKMGKALDKFRVKVERRIKKFRRKALKGEIRGEPKLLKGKPDSD